MQKEKDQQALLASLDKLSSGGQVPQKQTSHIKPPMIPTSTPQSEPPQKQPQPHQTHDKKMPPGMTLPPGMGLPPGMDLPSDVKVQSSNNVEDEYDIDSFVEDLQQEQANQAYEAPKIGEWVVVEDTPTTNPAPAPTWNEQTTSSSSYKPIKRRGAPNHMMSLEDVFNIDNQQPQNNKSSQIKSKLLEIDDDVEEISFKKKKKKSSA